MTQQDGDAGDGTFPPPQPEQLHLEMPALQAQLVRVLARRTLW